MQPTKAQANCPYRGLLWFVVLFAMVFSINSCSEKTAPIKYAYPDFFAEHKTIVQTDHKYYINDIAKGEVNK